MNGGIDMLSLANIPGTSEMIFSIIGVFLFLIGLKFFIAIILSHKTHDTFGFDTAQTIWDYEREARNGKITLLEARNEQKRLKKVLDNPYTNKKAYVFLFVISLIMMGTGIYFGFDFIKSFF